MAKRQLNRDYIEKLKKQGKISDDTYRICMAEGGVVPELPEWMQTARNTVQGFKDKVSDSVSGAVDAAKEWAVENASLPTKPAAQPSQADIQLASDTGDEIVPVNDLAVDQNPRTDEVSDFATAPYSSSLQAFDTLEKSYRASSDAASAAGIQEAGALKDYQTRLAEQQAKDAAAETERQQRLEKAETDYQNEVANYNKLSVDPQRFQNEFWGNKSTGQKIIAGIGLIFGGWGRNGNQAVKVLENAINRDIDAQKANIDRAGNALGQKRNVLAAMRDRFGDARTAEIAAKRAMYDAAELDLKRIGAMYKGADAKANMMKALAEIQFKKAELEQAMKKSALEQHAIQSLAGNDRNASYMAMLPEGLRERYVPGFGLALTKDSATKANEAVGQFNDAFSGIKELQGMLKNASSLSPTDRAKASTIAEMLKGALRVPIVGPGAVSESEWKLLDAIIANPTELFSLSSTNKARLSALSSRLQSKMNSQVAQYGLRPVKQLSLGERVR